MALTTLGTLGDETYQVAQPASTSAVSINMPFRGRLMEVGQTPHAAPTTTTQISCTLMGATTSAAVLLGNTGVASVSFASATFSAANVFSVSPTNPTYFNQGDVLNILASTGAYLGTVYCIIRKA